MADNYWGNNPELLTVSASPSPTTTGLTVSDATNLLVGQYVLIEVAGLHERAQIQSIVGDALTLTAPLSDAPDVPGEVVNSRELIGRDSLNQGAVFNAASVADLKTVDTTRASSGLKYQVSGVGLYRLDKASSSTADDYTVIAPTTGGGRWLLLQPFGAWATVTGSTTLAAGHKYITNSAARIPLTLPASAIPGYEHEIANHGAGGFSVALGGNSLRYNGSTYTGGDKLSSTSTEAAVRLLCTAAGIYTLIRVEGGITFATVGSGYLAGGAHSGDGGPYSSIERLTYATEAMSTLAATLGGTGFYDAASGVSGAAKGYFAGRYTGSPTSAIDDLNYANQTSSTLAATLSGGRYGAAGASSTTYGYFMGGNNGAAITTVDRLNLSTEAVSASGEALDAAQAYGASAQDANRAWLVAGQTSTAYSTKVQRLVFATEVTSDLGALLPRSSSLVVGISGPTAAFFAGGENGSGYQSTITKLTHATEALADIAATLDTAKSVGAGLSSSVKGYFAGGSTGAGTVNVIEDVNFATETSAALAAVLGQGRYSAQGVSSVNL